MRPSLLFSFALFLIVFLVSTTARKTRDVGFRLELTRVDAAKNLNRAEFLKLAVERSRKRALDPTVRPSESEYLVQLSVGTPPHPFTAILDTGSDLIWTQCVTCTNCIPQPDPFFDALGSSTLSTVPCSSTLCQAATQFECAPNCFYGYGYGDGTITQGFLGKETFTFGDTRIRNIAFGCGLFSSGSLSNASGILGFGRGPLSLISQLHIGTFSYCFTSYEDLTSKSPLLFGSRAKLTGKNIQTTPLLRNPDFETFYYVSLKGITVGKTRLSIPTEVFELKKDGSGGTIIDSGTNLLVLNEAAYDEVGKAFNSQVNLPAVNGTDIGDFDFCFKTSTETEMMPKLIFHFEGADWDLPQNNYMAYDNGTNLLCLMAMQSSNSQSIFGNVATQNMHVLYDLKNNKLSFEPTDCNKL